MFFLESIFWGFEISLTFIAYLVFFLILMGFGFFIFLEKNKLIPLPITNTYDVTVRLIAITDPLNNLTSYSYDAQVDWSKFLITLI
jgi:hypothetical protein